MLYFLTNGSDIEALSVAILMKYIPLLRLEVFTVKSLSSETDC